MTRVVKRTPDLGLTLRLQRVAELGGAVVALPDAGSGAEPGACSVSGVTWALGLPYDQHFLDDVDTGEPSILLPSVAYRNRTLFGIPLGDSPGGVVWQWSWSSAPERGETVEQSGAVLVVTVPSSDFVDDRYARYLSASAYCGDSLVGTLNLRVFYDPF